MERTDWLEAGYDSAQARFLMMTAITHHRFSSPAWGEDEIRRLHAELTEIDRSAAQVLGLRSGLRRESGGGSSGMYGLYRRPADRWGQDEQEAC
jgi:hypothetical protein